VSGADGRGGGSDGDPDTTSSGVPEMEPSRSSEPKSWIRERRERKLDKFNRRDPMGGVRDDVGHLSEITTTPNLAAKLGFRYGKVVSRPITTDRLEPGPSGRKVVQPERERAHLQLGGGRLFEITRVWEDVASPREEGHKVDHSLYAIRIGKFGYSWERRGGKTVWADGYQPDANPAKTPEMAFAERMIGQRQEIAKGKAQRARDAVDAWESLAVHQDLVEMQADVAKARALYESAKALGDKAGKKATKRELKEAEAVLRETRKELNEMTANRDAAIRDLKAAAKAIKKAKRAYRQEKARAANQVPFDIEHHIDTADGTPSHTPHSRSLSDFQSLLTAE